MNILLISSRSEIEPYIGEVRAAGDAARDSFGFLRKSAYEEFAAQGRMIIAIEASTRAMLGYVLYGGAMPQGKIFQTWAAPHARGNGVGRELILEVVRRLERFNFLSLRADVAQDLTHANQFYAALDFETITVKPAKTRGRRINVRVRELATPSLIDLAVDQADRGTCLPISLPHTERAPLYVLDLNVLFDVARARTQASLSGRVLGAGLENDVRLAVSAELVIELERNTDPNAPDPILQFAASLPRLPRPPRQRHDALALDLAPLIFPDRARAGRLTVRDKSDLSHLATAIHESAAGFITSEKAILRAAETLRQKHDLEVLSPAALGVSFTAEALEVGPIEVWARGSGVRAHLLQESDYEDADKFLIQRGVTASECRAVLASGTGTLPRRRHVVRVDGAVAAVAAWEAPRTALGTRALHLTVDEGSPAASLASDYLIRRAIADVGAAPPTIFELTSRPGQPSVRRAAIANGFFRIRSARTQTQTLQKVAMARAVLPNDWSTFRQAVRARAGMELPEEQPTFSSISQTIEITSHKGECVTLTLGDFERLLSPLLLVLPERPAVILPITQRYAEELFSGSAQPGLLGGREAALRSVRGYIGGRATYKTIPEGGLAVFYESGRGGGRKAITAVARVTRKYLMAKESASQMLSEKAVLEATAVKSLGRGEQIVVTEFEDLMLLREPVRLRALRAIGCVGGANFVTACSATHEHVVAILRAGEAHA